MKFEPGDIVVPVATECSFIDLEHVEDPGAFWLFNGHTQLLVIASYVSMYEKYHKGEPIVVVCSEGILYVTHAVNKLRKVG